jgi:acyl carrier protein
MCIRAGSNELESVKNLMGLSLMAVIAESLEIDIDEVDETSRLVADLHMDSEGKQRLEGMIAEVFDELQVNLNTTPTVGSLIDKVVMSEFADDGIRQYVGLDLLELTNSAA